MGNLCSCCGGQAEQEVLTPDINTRRRMQEEAAERRRLENESRGVKDIEKVRRQQAKSLELERLELEAAKKGTGNPNLRWQRD